MLNIDTTRLNEAVDYVANCTDEEFAEFFVRLNLILWKFGTDRFGRIAETSEDLDIRAKDMYIDVEELSGRIEQTLTEIIYDEDIDASAWWKGETA